MLGLIKKVLVLVLMSVNNSRNNIIENITRNFMPIPKNNFYRINQSLLLKNQECKVRKLIVDMII